MDRGSSALRPRLDLGPGTKGQCCLGLRPGESPVPLRADGREAELCDRKRGSSQPVPPPLLSSRHVSLGPSSKPPPSSSACPTPKEGTPSQRKPPFWGVKILAECGSFLESDLFPAATREGPSVAPASQSPTVAATRVSDVNATSGFGLRTRSPFPFCQAFPVLCRRFLEPSLFSLPFLIHPPPPLRKRTRSFPLLSLWSLRVKTEASVIYYFFLTCPPYIRFQI